MQKIASLALVEFVDQQLDPISFPGRDSMIAVEVALGIASAFFDFPLNQLVIPGIEVIIEGRGNLADFEWRKESVVDPILEGIDEHGLAEIGVGIGIEPALWRGGQAELHGRAEIFQDAAPGAFVIGAASVAFVDDDEVEKIGRVIAEARARSLEAETSESVNRALEQDSLEHVCFC